MSYMSKVAKLLSLFHTCGDTTCVVVSLAASLTANHRISLQKCILFCTLISIFLSPPTTQWHTRWQW